MQINVTRLDGRRYATVVTRHDGVSLSVPGYGFMHSLPHDLAHFVVENGLNVRQGFWGSVANDAVFSGMAVLAGRRKPGADERSRTVQKLNAAGLNAAEVLVSCFVTIVDGGLDRTWPSAAAEIRARTGHLGREAPSVGAEEGAATCKAWRTTQAQWEALPRGGSMLLNWPDLTRRRR